MPNGRNQSFLSSIVTPKEELNEVRNQFEELSKSVKMMTSGTHKLDDLLGQGKRCDDKRGLGFSERGSDRTKNKTCVCKRRTEWRPKVNMENCKVAFTSVHNPTSTDQYVNSGCSRHMTEIASFFSKLSECNAGSVMFNYSSVHTMVVTRVKSYQSTAFVLVHHSFASFESSHMTPIDVVGTAPFVIYLNMRLFQGSHISDVSVEFDTVSGDSRASAAVSLTIGQPLVLSVVCVQALMVESLSLTGQITWLFGFSPLYLMRCACLQK
ncbi:flocculation protein FLO11-like [Cucumis melo var. makuwa]|uniref:Flocculation protein FLO11-like n=1 Tax=Cucumis melo var. makuwa TaxID=1194695 RepID=A0A5D3DTJ1_CUCMM|nr:flocculation protein FLO11-like [Cucumis melo var. makuwa]TYK26858.1 flocculation protein FLO11-like [Cucumis melo var. makuwa]